MTTKIYTKWLNSRERPDSSTQDTYVLSVSVGNDPLAHTYYTHVPGHNSQAHGHAYGRSVGLEIAVL